MLSVAAFLALLTVPLIAQGQVIEQQLERVESAQQALAKHDYQSALSHRAFAGGKPSQQSDPFDHCRLIAALRTIQTGREIV